MSEPPIAPMGILIVDPAPAELRHLKLLLESYGWRVWAAADAANALRVFADQRTEIGAVVVDLQLPGLQGARVLAELGNLSPSLVRLAMSADLPAYAITAFRRLSATPLFEKPVRVREMDLLLRESMTGDNVPRTAV